MEFEEEAARWISDDAVRRRRAERLARDFDQASMEWVGILVAAAERDAEVIVVTDDDRSRRCHIVAVGHDVVMATTPRGAEMLLGLSHLHSISLPDSALLATGLDVPPASDVSLCEVAAEWAAERRRVSVRSGSTTRSGTLMAAGTDVVAMAADNGEIVYLRAESVSVISSSES